MATRNTAGPAHELATMAPALALLTTLIAAVLPDDPPRPAILPGEHELPLVHGRFAAPTAWLALWRGDAWVC